MSKGRSGKTVPFKVQKGDQGELTLVFGSRLDMDSVPPMRAAIAKLVKRQPPSRIILDLSQLDYLDTVGALELRLMTSPNSGLGVPVEYRGLNPSTGQLLDLIHLERIEAPPLRPAQQSIGVIEQIGASARSFAAEFSGLVEFLGQLVMSFVKIFYKPQLLRVGDVVDSMERVGVQGLPIVGLISLLLGMIMAFMSSLQLKSFGASIYVATLVAVAMVRELGPIMTAILVAGRSGASFAAEIGTMKVNEEVDALEVMGFDSPIFLAVPKVIAAVAMVPILTLFADALAIAGGLFVGVLGLDLTVYAYMEETFAHLSLMDVAHSLWKSAVFGLLIAAIGCQRGFHVGSGAAGVGTATTSAVVTSLFMIIVADSVFALFLYYF